MPLPKPRIGENRLGFLDRCIVNREVQNEFADIDQRIAVCSNLFENKSLIKATKEEQEWQENFENELDKAEAKEIIPVRRYLNREYALAIEEYLKTQNTNNWTSLFKEYEIAVIYSILYANIGTRFSKLFKNTNTGKFPNEFNTDNYSNIWRDKFRQTGLKISEVKGKNVSIASQKEITRIIAKLHKDPSFQALNEREAGRILKSQFKGLTDYKARRIVRTEATNAANFATLQTASDMYGIENVKKTWLASFFRTRDTHAAANGQSVNGNEKFLVGGEYLTHPGSGSLAENNINCRCSILIEPKPVPEF